LSVAFTKEESAETAAETLLPDRPISPHPNGARNDSGRTHWHQRVKSFGWKNRSIPVWGESEQSHPTPEPGRISMISLYASFGALIGTLIAFLGFGIHLGQTYYFGAPAYFISAVAGSGVALVIRHVVRKEFGPIVP
jgi:hypothetical protein